MKVLFKDPRLKGLYTKTGVDWNLDINICLTEPACPVVIIYPEGMQITKFMVVCDFEGIENAVEEAIDKVYKAVMLGEFVPSDMPFTNPDDAKLEELLIEWNKK